jgi:hypothetical protein
VNTVLLRVAVLAAGILSGAVLGVWLTEVALGDAAALWIGYHQAIRAPYTLALPPVGAVALVAAALVLLRPGSRPFRGPLVAVLVCLAVGMVITVAGHFPINAMIDTWSPAAPPADWEQLRDRWVLAHAVRSVLALVAFVLLVVVASRDPARDRSSLDGGARGERVSHSLPG